jgi:Rieske Fe-S protein
MMLKMLAGALMLSVTIGVGAVHAQDSAPPAKSSTTTSDADKKAISKACTDQANAKGLHGKERKKFRAQCKKNGGKTPQ